MDEQKKEQPTEFPFMIRAVNKIFKIASNRYISCSLSLILLSVAYLLDCYNKQPLFIEKFSAFVVIFGILLTIKHNFIKNTDNPKDYILNHNGGGLIIDQKIETDIKYYDEAKSAAYDEVVGFIFIIIGTLLNVFGSFIPLINLCK